MINFLIQIFFLMAIVMFFIAVLVMILRLVKSFRALLP